MKILVTGINGFIGSHFLDYVIANTDWEILGVDISDSYVSRYARENRFSFHKLDISENQDSIRELILQSDLAILLAGIARPAEYVQHPLKVFELDFEYNYQMVKMCADAGVRIIFPSTSEVYGLGNDQPMNEEKTNLVLGPICETRWIYSNAKQMMDRIIFALGQERGLGFTIIRPFNWTGPRLDSFAHAKQHQARAITQMVYDSFHHHEIVIAGEGNQKRSFTWIGDGIEAIVSIIKAGDAACGKIFNIGNPDNNCSIKEFAELLLSVMKEFPETEAAARQTVLKEESYASYYGINYADTINRIPDISNIKSVTGWSPVTPNYEIIKNTIESIIRNDV
ncbi:MAG: bifunctional UDP-4-keto-pentose/UDP-xylose synthase [Bacteroidales bacterium]|nr:bifunctional UDP-4-keto-pentose/UDP-xylose synthase [Bacteroidales bacterium]